MHAGDPLVVVDPTGIREQLTAAQAEFTAAQSELTNAQAAITQAQSRIASAQSQYTHGSATAPFSGKFIGIKHICSRAEGKCRTDHRPYGQRQPDAACCTV